MNARLRDLVEGYVTGTLEEPELTELEGMLASSEEARLSFLAYLEVHAGLAWEFRGDGTTSGADAGEEKIITAFPRVWAVAAALIFLATLSLFFFVPETSAGTIARVTASFHGQGQDGEEIASGLELEAGVWELQSGLVELRTGQGTTLLLEGPASLELKDALHAKLIAGNLVVKMPKGESGFVVEMPRMKVTDLGTEFGVSVNPDGESSVQVYDGKVRAESGQSSSELVAGETKLSTADGGFASMPFREERFIRTFPPVRPDSQAGGPLYNRAALESVSVAEAPPSMAIDGDLQEWDQSAAFRSACQPPYAETYFMKGAMTYDRDGIYISAQVGDPAPMMNAGRPGMEFAGGSVIVRLAADRPLGWPLKGSTVDARSAAPMPDSISERISSLILWYDAKAGEARLSLMRGFDFHGRESDPSGGWSGAFRKAPDGRGYTLEYRIPWSLLNCADDPPRAGDTLATLWTAHWSDAEGRICRGQLVDVVHRNPKFPRNLQPHIYFQNGAFWGKARFLPAPK